MSVLPDLRGMPDRRSPTWPAPSCAERTGPSDGKQGNCGDDFREPQSPAEPSASVNPSGVGPSARVPPVQETVGANPLPSHD